MKPKTFKAKPILIEALPFASHEDFVAIKNWMAEYTKMLPIYSHRHVTMDIPVRDGILKVRRGDYVVRESGSHFFPVAKDVFERSYSEE